MCGVQVPEEMPKEKDADGCLVEKPSTAKPDAEKTATETPSAEKPDTEQPDTVKPDTEKPDSENPGAGQSSTGSKETEVGQSTNPQKEISKYDCHAACGTMSN